IPVLNPETWRAEATETLELTDELTQGRKVYALRVKGFSMISSGRSHQKRLLLELLPSTGYS
ncbi:MAG: hypothetical protein SV062_04955, partial [Thermodesulfobacteriota bacterium]|nr:hypothetical protein [Thermodesulfobacteriota bacterium]